jgi:hypothetical protein
MKIEDIIPLSLAIACIALFGPHLAQAGTTSAQAQPNNTARATQEAAQMVSADVALAQTIDAKKILPGYEFDATLERTVQLKNGPELKAGTVLLGAVTADETAPNHAWLALRFTSARLKNGQTVPIKATITNIEPPQGLSQPSMADEASAWDGQTLSTEELGVLKNVDMHSSIAGRNSAVFVSQKVDDVRLQQGTQLGLALAERAGQRQNTSGGA